MELLSPGEKLRQIRKQFKIRQQDITGGEITRELISMIENNKSKLSPAVAQIITDNINRICKERNLDFNLDLSYLLQDVNDQANKIADTYIEFLDENEDNISVSFMEDIKKIETFLMNYDVEEKKMIIYEKIGDILTSQKEYNTSLIYYIKAFENHDRFLVDVKLFNLIKKIGNTLITLGRYKEALDYNNLALSHNNITDELKYKILFNNTLAYIYLKKYDNAINEIEYLHSTFKTLSKTDSFELNVLKVNCLRMKCFYNDALQLNKDLLKSIDNNDFENTVLIVGNILDIYTELKDFRSTKIYIDKFINKINSFNEINSSYHGPNAYRQIALSANLIGNPQLSKEYYKKSIRACKYHKNLDVLKKSLNELLNLLITENSQLEIDEFKNELLELISLNIVSYNNINIFKVLNYYNSINDNESIKSILDFILDKAK